MFSLSGLDSVAPAVAGAALRRRSPSEVKSSLRELSSRGIENDMIGLAGEEDDAEALDETDEVVSASESGGVIGYCIWLCMVDVARLESAIGGGGAGRRRV